MCAKLFDWWIEQKHHMHPEHQQSASSANGTKKKYNKITEKAIFSNTHWREKNYDKLCVCRSFSVSRISKAKNVCAHHIPIYRIYCSKDFCSCFFPFNFKQCINICECHMSGWLFKIERTFRRNSQSSDQQKISGKSVAEGWEMQTMAPGNGIKYTNAVVKWKRCWRLFCCFHKHTHPPQHPMPDSSVN